MHNLSYIIIYVLHKCLHLQHQLYTIFNILWRSHSVPARRTTTSAWGRIQTVKWDSLTSKSACLISTIKSLRHKRVGERTSPCFTPEGIVPSSLVSCVWWHKIIISPQWSTRMGPILYSCILLCNTRSGLLKKTTAAVFSYAIESKIM